MEKLLLGLIIASSFTAFAQTTVRIPLVCDQCVLDCHYKGLIYQNTQYDRRERILVISDYNSDESSVIYNVKMRWVEIVEDVDVYYLEDNDGNLILRLLKNYKGSDNRNSHRKYQYSAFNSEGKRAGGCNMRERREYDAVAQIINNLHGI